MENVLYATGSLLLMILYGLVSPSVEAWSYILISDYFDLMGILLGFTEFEFE
jgi:hypothetical protein